jgi:hypothetical protein
MGRLAQQPPLDTRLDYFPPDEHEDAYYSSTTGQNLIREALSRIGVS